MLPNANSAAFTWQNLANKTVFKCFRVRDNSQRQLSQNGRFPSEMRFRDGDSAKVIFVLPCISNP
ncbi:MAG: hypothetical protein DMF26_15655 [Verrucomicrobia bacterium]|nr:MAG: hypothetical protein DMF26_15655 [Verrucomicrobiota bacterium]